MRLKTFKITITLLVLCMIYISRNDIYAITEEFKFVIDTIGIPRYNVYGEEINEEIYKAYNVFAYSWPERISGGVGQRWKNSKYGLWSKNIGAYRGNGVRGEYNLLGRDYSGNYINNYYFPVDTLPTDTPENWNYYSNPGASASWEDKNKYKYIEQLKYMKNTKLLFNDISSRDNSDNPEKIKEYNITASKIGLDKARLDVCSTWKTNGIIHTRRKVGNSIRYAVFLTRPMAANADIKGRIDINNSNVVLKSNQDEIEIEIEYGSNIINMTGYANKNHIKEINSKLYINGKEVDCISGSKTDILGKKYILKLSRKDLRENTNNTIKIVNDSYAHTEFAVDGLMQNNVEKNLNIFVEEKIKIPTLIDDIRVVEKQNGNLVVRPLAQHNISKDADSLGITESGKYIGIKLKINNDINIEKIKGISIKLNNEQLNDIEKIISKSKEYIVLKARIPIYTSSTIYGWKSLREIYGNYFGISESEVGKRILDPHLVEIKINYAGKDSVVSLKIDTIDDYITNINYRYEDDFVNNNNDVIDIEEWIN